MNAQPMYGPAEHFSRMPTWFGLFVVVGIVLVVLFATGSQRGRKRLAVALGIGLLLLMMFGWTSVRMAGPPQMAQMPQHEAPRPPATKQPQTVDPRKKEKESKGKSNSSKGKSNKKNSEKAPAK